MKEERMNIGGIIFGAIAAVIGAVAWAAIAYFGKLEIGYLAWGIGFLVGLGVSFGSSKGGVGPAVVAVLLTVLSLLGGKYVAVSMLVSDLDSQMPEFSMDDDAVRTRLACIEYESARADGQSLKFRNGTNYETATTVADFPKGIADQAVRQFDLMTEDEKDQLKQEAEEELNTAIVAFESEITKQAFVESFGLIDIIFFLLGIVTAGRIALVDSIE